jgi:hypothetical protein
MQRVGVLIDELDELTAEPGRLRDAGGCEAVARGRGVMIDFVVGGRV